VLLLTPGPTPLPDEVRLALARPMIHHRTDEFRALYRRVSQGLARVFRTAGPVLPIAGSGTTAFEAAALSLVRPGDTVVCATCGRFGERWAEGFERFATLLDLRVVRVEDEWGAPSDPARLEAALRRAPGAAIVTMVHCDTSTCTASDLQALAGVTRAHAPEALTIVDSVSALGATPLEMDAWGLDAVVTGSQKALMCPPGLGMVGLSERALRRLSGGGPGRSAAPMSLDLRLHLEGHADARPPFTPPVSHFFALEAALALIEREGVEAVWRATRARAELVRECAWELSLTLLSSSPSDSVTGIRLPDGVSDRLRRACVERHGVLLADGQDRFAGKAVRFSHMGAVSLADTHRGVDALRAELARLM
jgi:aspartate aminotransferase-like enzyme